LRNNHSTQINSAITWLRRPIKLRC